MCRSSCKSSLCGVCECIQTGIIFCPNLLAYWWRSINAGNKFRRKLDHAINSISEVRHSTRRKRRRKEAKSPSLTICADQGCLIQERFLLSHDEADYVMREVHEGICGNHLGARSLVHKLIRAGYYWPTMLKDAQAYVKTYDKCQRFNNLIRQPSEELTPMTALWLFAQWGLDIMGPFLTALRQLNFW